MEDLLLAHPGKTMVLFNPDLELKGATLGIRERDRRQGFLDSFKSAFAYLVLVSQCPTCCQRFMLNRGDRLLPTARSTRMAARSRKRNTLRCQLGQ